MSKTMNDNFDHRHPKAADQRTGKLINDVWFPFESVAEAIALVPIEFRHRNLVQFILKDGFSIRYRYRDGVADEDLIEEVFGGGGGDAVFTQDLTAELGDDHVGGVNTGKQYLTGSPLEQAIRDMLTEIIPPEYDLPTLILSSTQSGQFESGTIISPVFNRVFNQNDGGPLTTESLKKEGVQISTTYPFTSTNLVVEDGNLTFQSQANYSDGPIKDNNLGDPDPTGQILAGFVNSNTIVITGKRKAFWDTPASLDDVTTSANVRALSNNLLNPAGVNFIINIPIGTAEVVFAFPSTLSLNYVEYIELSNSDIQDAFEESTVLVEGASSYTPINYKVYIFRPVEPFTTTATYRVKAS